MYKRKTFVGFDLDDGSPIDSKERVEYVGRVVSFFHDIFRKKLESMIVSQENQLIDPSNSRETDLYIKANINALSLLLDWGDEMLGEHIQHIEDLKNQQNNPEDDT